MAKASKKTKKKQVQEEKPIEVNGTFMDFIGVVIKDAKSKDKKLPEKPSDK